MVFLSVNHLLTTDFFKNWTVPKVVLLYCYCCLISLKDSTLYYLPERKIAGGSCWEGGPRGGAFLFFCAFSLLGWVSTTTGYYLLYSWKLMPSMCASEQLQLCASKQKAAWCCWNRAFLLHAFLHQRGFQMKFWIFKDLCDYRLVDFFTTAALHPLKSVLSLLLTSALISTITPPIISTRKLDCKEIQIALQREKQ